MIQNQFLVPSLIDFKMILDSMCYPDSYIEHHIDKYNYIVHTILEKQVLNRDLSSHGYTNINMQVLRSFIGKRYADDILHELVRERILQRSYYIPGVKSFAYRVAPKYRSKATLRSVYKSEVWDRKLGVQKRAYKAQRKNLAEFSNLCKLEIDAPAAQAFIDTMHDNSMLVLNRNAAQLGAIQEKKAVDVLIEWLKTEDPKVAARAHQQVSQFTGRDWGYVPTDPLDARLKRVAMLNKWWKENRDTFKLQVDPRLVKGSTVVDAAGAPAADPKFAALRNLSSTDPKLAAQAESDLLANGEKSVPFLITGLTNDSPITVRACNRLLQQVAKRSDLNVNPRDTPEERQKAVAAWRDWATEKKLLPEEDETEAEEEDDEKAEKVK